MIATIHTQGARTLAQICAFVEGGDPIAFTLTDRAAAEVGSKKWTPSIV
jgi:hypothetical protein